MNTLLVRRQTVKLDGTYFVLEIFEYNDGSCRAQVVYSASARPRSSDAVVVMIHQRASVELAVAAIARDFSTFATRSLAILPTIGQLVDADVVEEGV